MTEAALWKYLSENWPMLTLQIGAFLVLLRGYLKLKAFVDYIDSIERRQATLEQSFKNLMNFCLSKNKARALEILRPTNKEGG